jgi:hypothetical protein
MGESTQQLATITPTLYPSTAKPPILQDFNKKKPHLHGALI